MCAYSDQYIYGASGSRSVADFNLGTYIVLHDDLVANMNGTVVVNQSSIDARAAERMTDWIRKRLLCDRPVLNIYSGLVDFNRVPGARYEKVVWEDRGDGFKTIVRAYPDESLENWKRNCDYYPCVGAGGSGGNASGSGSDSSSNYIDVVTNVCLIDSSASGSTSLSVGGVGP
jgi:hypothetical protein